MMHILNVIIGIISGTPLWVWAIFAYLIFIGIKSLDSQKIFLPRLLIIPVLMLGLRYKVFLLNDGILPLLYLLSGLVLGLGLGIFSATVTKIKQTQKYLTIELPGSPAMLIILILFFCEKYAFGYIQATNQVLAKSLLIYDFSIGGLFSGYLLGKTIWFLYTSYTTKNS